MVCRKFEYRLHSESRTVRLALYCLGQLTSVITDELFADGINESGVLRHYFSKDEKDSMFGSLGCWEELETKLEGQAETHHLRRTFSRIWLLSSTKGHVVTARTADVFCSPLV